jgi:hypothetical protein
VSPEWLSSALSADVTSCDLEQIGIGVGLLGRLYRVTAHTNNGPMTAIAKFPTLDEGARANVAHPLNFYEKEVRFYQETGASTPVPIPAVYAAEHDKDSGDFVLLIEDLGGKRMEDQIAGCPVADAYKAVDTLVDLHAHWWDKDFPEWLPSYSDPPFPQVIEGMYRQAWPKAREVFSGHLPDEIIAFGERYPGIVPFFMDELSHKPWTMCHGDYRLDNLFFGDGVGDPPVTVVDWQIAFRGRGGYDVGYFVSQSLDTQCRRDHEQALKDKYREGLGARGIDYPADELEKDYRRTVAYCFIYAVVTAGQIEVTNDRMLELILRIGDRAVQAIQDNDALSVLPD